MDILKEYYCEQAISQPNSTLKIDQVSVKARQFTVRRLVFIAIVVALSIGFTTGAYAVARRFVDRADVGSGPTFVVVGDESQAGWARDSFSPVEGFTYLEESDEEASGDGLDPHRYLNLAESYEEAVARFGRVFQVPGIFGFTIDLISFGLPDVVGEGYYNITVVLLNYNNQMIVYTVNREDSPVHGSTEIRIVGTIEELLISNVKVYRISTGQSEAGEILRFLWTHDGLTYDLYANPEYNLSETELLEVIASMIPLY